MQIDSVLIGVYVAKSRAENVRFMICVVLREFEREILIICLLE